jgi:hypothetical protein
MTAKALEALAMVFVADCMLPIPLSTSSSTIEHVMHIAEGNLIAQHVSICA